MIKRLVNRNQVQSYQTKFKLEDGRVINDNFNISKHFNDFLPSLGLIWPNTFQKSILIP